MTDNQRQGGEVVLTQMRKSFGNFEALKGIDLKIEPREFFALLGPSGSGKTTTLRMIAGLDTPDSGTVVVDGVDMTHAPPGERDVAMVFQNYALYPHMTVRQNVGFPLKMDGVPRASIEAQVAEAAERVKIAHLLHRRPGELSGGQQQRVALARAIVRKPKLFLLDEPLSNLDAQLRLETRVELKNLQRNLNVTAIYVTHDQEEAMTLADRMAVFMDGKIVQIGTPSQVFNRPESVQVASFIGSPPMNLFDGQLNGSQLDVHGITLQLASRVGPSRPVTVGVRPGDLRIEHGGMSTTLYLAENLGESWLLNLHLHHKLIKLRCAQMPPQLDASTAGSVVPVSFDASAVHLFDPQTGLRLAETTP
ncbi:MAG: ABC transporter ATP-binding protein [Burkholderiaceae bacterium]